MQLITRSFAIYQLNLVTYFPWQRIRVIEPRWLVRSPLRSRNFLACLLRTHFAQKFIKVTECCILKLPIKFMHLHARAYLKQCSSVFSYLLYLPYCPTWMFLLFHLLTTEFSREGRVFKFIENYKIKHSIVSVVLYYCKFIFICTCCCFGDAPKYLVSRHKWLADLITLLRNKIAAFATETNFQMLMDV